MPTLTYNRIVSNNNYIKLFDTLGDSKSDVRYATIDFFRAVNRLIIQRDPNERRSFTEAIYRNTERAMMSSDQYLIHGNLLITGFLLTETEDLLADKHEELF